MNTTDREILDKMRRLSPRQKAEVIDFIDFVGQRKEARAPLERFLRTRVETSAGIADVRRRLAKIPGNMSDTIRALRDERG